MALFQLQLIAQIPYPLTLLHSEQPKLHTVKAVLSVIGLKCIQRKIAEFANCVDPDEVAHYDTPLLDLYPLLSGPRILSTK